MPSRTRGCKEAEPDSWTKLLFSIPDWDIHDSIHQGLMQTGSNAFFPDLGTFGKDT
jgi:hypothetical protein